VRKRGNAAIVTAVVLIIVSVIAAIFFLRSGLGRVQPAAEALNLGEKYLLEMDYEQALVQFLTAIEIEPMNPRGYTGAAEAYMRLGDAANAEAILARGLAVLPSNIEIQEKLAELSAVFGTESEAEPEEAAPPPVQSFERYIGTYTTNRHEERGENPEFSAGYDLEIFSISDGEIVFGVSYIGRSWSPIYETGEIIATLTGNTADFQWADSWGNEGYGMLRLAEDSVGVRMIQTVSAEVNRASFDTGAEIMLTPFEAADNAEATDAEGSAAADSPPVNMLADMSKAERTALHTFFSNFSEVGLREFNAGSYSVNELADFALWHHYRNNWSRFSYGEDGFMILSSGDVEQAANRYFGISDINHAAYTNDWNYYRNGAYYLMGADGEPLSWSQVTSFADNGDGTFTARYDVYQSHAAPDNLYEDIADWRLGGTVVITKDDPNRLHGNVWEASVYAYSCTAVVALHEYDGRQSYKLLSLAVDGL